MYSPTDLTKLNDEVTAPYGIAGKVLGFLGSEVLYVGWLMV